MAPVPTCNGLIGNDSNLNPSFSTAVRRVPRLPPARQRSRALLPQRRLLPSPPQPVLIPAVNPAGAAYGNQFLIQRVIQGTVNTANTNGLVLLPNGHISVVPRGPMPVVANIHGGGTTVRPMETETRQRRVRRSRTHFNEENLARLEAEYAKDRYPEKERMTAIASELDLPDRSVPNWFRNRRSKEKNQPQTQARLPTPAHPQHLETETTAGTPTILLLVQTQHQQEPPERDLLSTALALSWLKDLLAVPTSVVHC